jgi:hypothetical protein
MYRRKSAKRSAKRSTKRTTKRTTKRSRRTRTTRKRGGNSNIPFTAPGFVGNANIYKERIANGELNDF